MEELDENGDGEIDFQEFMAMMTHQARVNCAVAVGFGVWFWEAPGRYGPPQVGLKDIGHV